MDYNKKGYKIALIALIFALIALSISGMPGIDGTNGTNAVLGTLTFSLHNISSDVTEYNSLKMDSVIVADVNKTQRTTVGIPNGVTLIQNWTSLSMNLTLIPAGAISMHIHALKVDGIAHDTKLQYDVGIVNSTGGNFISVGISDPQVPYLTTSEEEYTLEGVMLEKIINNTDRLALRLYTNQTGTGALPDVTIYMDDLTVSRLTIPAIPIDLTALINQVSTNQVNIDNKVNKSGDNITGVLITNVTTGYTGLGYTIYEGGRSSAKSKVRYVINDVNGAFNMRINIKDDLTPDESYPTSGFAFGMRPSVDDFIVSRLHWNSEGILDGNELVFQVVGNTSAYFSGNISSSKLAGIGNDYACLDSTGKLFRSDTAC